MNFWKLAYEEEWADIIQLRMATKTKENPFGFITPEEFEEITGEKF